MIYIGLIPIVSLDKIYLPIDNENIIFLDCTRLDGSKQLVSRNNSDSFYSVDKQIEDISNFLKEKNINEIILADDVVFSGSVLKTIIDKFSNYSIDVIGIRSSISTNSSFEMFNNELELGLRCGFLLEDSVIDQICERDFYFGIGQSGISVVGSDNLIYKAPYFKPFGNPIERASIPEEFEKEFSIGCINRNVALWKEIENLSEKTFYIRDLPEKIVNTNENEEVIKTLKKGMKRI